MEKSEPQPEPETAEEYPPLRILLVDDNATNRELARRILEAAGAEVHEAGPAPRGDISAETAAPLANALQLSPPVSPKTTSPSNSTPTPTPPSGLWTAGPSIGRDPVRVEAQVRVTVPLLRRCLPRRRPCSSSPPPQLLALTCRPS